METHDPKEEDPTDGPSPDITKALARVQRLDDEAAAEVLPVLYAELRRLAESHMRREAAGHTLQPTAIVHEAYLKLVRGAEWSSREQFFGIASRAMRQILVDHARGRNADKRGGGQAPASLTLSEVPGSAGSEDLAGNLDVIALNAAIEELSSMDERIASVVDLRFFGGLTVKETARVLGVSSSTVDDDWSFARVWLRRKLGAES